MADAISKETVDNVLFDILAKEGYSAFIDTALSCLNINNRGNDEARAQFNGEVCEVVLMGTSQAYIRQAKRKAQVFHSVVLKNLDKLKSGFRTELDFVMVTPYFILTTECKSYYGDIEISDNCTLRHRGRNNDIYSQSVLHYKHLKKYARQFVLPSAHIAEPPVFANAFLFSKGNVTDLRTPEQKRTIRLNRTSDVMQFYDAMFKKYRTPVFDYEHACHVFKECAASKKLHQQHREFLGY